jgi:arylsulfatase A-like enzyme
VFSIHNTLLKIPLVVVFPDRSRRGSVRGDTAQLLDLFPTILQLCGIDYEGRWDGRDLFAGDTPDSGSYVMSEYYYPRQVLSVFDPEELAANVERFEPYMKRLRALQNDEYKLIWGSDGSRELYRIGDDPGELTNLLVETPDHPALAPMVSELDRMVDAYQGKTPLDPPPPVGWLGPGFEERVQDPELLKKLRSLGYVK